jgi:hypothetical protein
MESGAVVIEGGSGPESVSTASPTAVVVASIKKSPIVLRIEICIDFKTARMNHPEDLDYHHRWASRSRLGPTVERLASARISALVWQRAPQRAHEFLGCMAI